MATVTHAVRRGTPGLGGDTATPQALTTGERRIIDHGHLETVLDQVAGSIFPARATADDHHIVVILPLGQFKAAGRHGSRGRGDGNRC